MLYYRRRGSAKAKRAEMYCYPAAATAGRSRNVRLATEADMVRCTELINGMFERYFDAHPVYDSAYLSSKLAGTPSVYGPNDYYVFDDGGEVVACAGLWDRGRHMRERWRNKSSGEERIVENAALIDFGFVVDREDAFAAMVEHLVGLTSDFGRAHLMAPLQFLPQVTKLLAHLQPAMETRAWYWNNNATLRSVGFKPERPYMGLEYW